MPLNEVEVYMFWLTDFCILVLESYISISTFLHSIIIVDCSLGSLISIPISSFSETK